MKPNHTPAVRALARTFLLVALASCGGGDDSVSAPAPAPAAAPAPAPAAAATCGIPEFRSEALRLVNARRAAGADCGVHGRFGPAPAVEWNDRLAEAASGHAADMAAQDYFEHEGRDGRAPAQRVSDEGYVWRTVGENIAAGQRTITQVVDGWVDSDSHCSNLMDPRFVHMGMACASDADSTYGRYWVQVLAAPR